MIVITAATLLAFLATISNAGPQGPWRNRSGDRRNMPQEARRWHSRSDEEHHSSHSEHNDRHYHDGSDRSRSHSKSDRHSYSKDGSHSHRGDRSHSHSHSDDRSHSHSHSHSDDHSHSHSHSDDHQCNKRHEPKWIHKGQGWDSKWESDKEWKQHEKKDSRHEKHRGVCHHDHRFFETSYVPHEHAEEACRKQGGYLAHIDDANFLEAVRAAYKCSGAFSESWIDSWNGDNYRHTCLVLSTGNAPGGGAINVPRECCKPRRALCMKGYRHKEHHHKPCHHGKDCDRHGHKEHHKPCHHSKDCDHKEHHKEHHHKDKDCKGKGCGCGCNCNCQNVFYRYDGNRLPIIGPGGEFQYYAVPGYVADDGALSIVNGALQVNSKVFTKTSPDISDNAKYLLLSTKTFTLPQKGSVSFSATVGAQVFGVNGQPFGAQVTSPENDPRLANGAFIVTDLSKSFLFGFSITNGTIYGGYRRSASTRSLYGNYAGFFQSGPLAKVMPGEPHRLSLVFNSDEQSLSYILDGEERYKLRNLGSLVSDQFSGVNLGGTQESYWPANLTVGFGTTNFLNSYQTCYQTIPAPDGGRICQYPANEMGLVNLTAYSPQFNPRATTQLATFVADNTDVTRRLFGQGAIMTIRDLTVGYCKEPRIFDENRRD